ncbi:MAG TPA: hypothetical protein VGM56_30815 [Byssovorax sp.]|jgi:hypothetical protein
MNEGARIHEEQRARILANVPGWYRPSVHLAIPTLIGLGIMAAALSRLHGVTALELLAVPATLFFAFGFEWRAHKMVLHRRQPLLGVIYERHELNHHVVFTYDDMPMREGRELWLILMPAYAIVLVFALVAPLALGVAWLASTNAALLLVATAMVFFLSYEWLHMAYHLPAKGLVGGSAILARMREHHRRHHDPRLMKRWNFNVTVPVFDLLCRTSWSPAREAARPPRAHAAQASRGA